MHVLLSVNVASEGQCPGRSSSLVIFKEMCSESHSFTCANKK